MPQYTYLDSQFKLFLRRLLFFARKAERAVWPWFSPGQFDEVRKLNGIKHHDAILYDLKLPSHHHRNPIRIWCYDPSSET